MISSFAVAVAALVLSVIHLVGARLHFISYIPRSRWLSFAGGVSVSYVFLHLLPEVAETADAVQEEVTADVIADDAAWISALLGLMLFYGIEVASRRSRARPDASEGTDGGVFGFSIVSYAVYNLMIAYLLHERVAAGMASLVLFAIGMGLHFLVNDFSLREHHRQQYARIGRWVLVATLWIGAFLGSVTELPEVAVGAVIAFIGGGVALNVLKEELPSEADSRFGPFAAGSAGYAVLLLFL